jgi:hypothetical protein
MPPSASRRSNGNVVIALPSVPFSVCHDHVSHCFGQGGNCAHLAFALEGARASLHSRFCLFDVVFLSLRLIIPLRSLAGRGLLLRWYSYFRTETSLDWTAHKPKAFGQ